MLCRIDLADPATVATLEACARAVTGLAGHGLMAMVEPFMSHRVDGQVRNDLSAEAVVTSVAIASGLGATSAYSWLKLPVVPGMDAVMAATTLPTLLLGGDPDGDPEETYGQWEKALALPGVRGLVVGRTLLYPQDGDVAAAVDVAAGLVHGGRHERARGSRRERGSHEPAPSERDARPGRVGLRGRPGDGRLGVLGLRVLELAAARVAIVRHRPGRDAGAAAVRRRATVTCGGVGRRARRAAVASAADRPTSPTCRSARP